MISDKRHLQVRQSLALWKTLLNEDLIVNGIAKEFKYLYSIQTMRLTEKYKEREVEIERSGRWLPFIQS